MNVACAICGGDLTAGWSGPPDGPGFAVAHHGCVGRIGMLIFLGNVVADKLGRKLGRNPDDVGFDSGDVASLAVGVGRLAAERDRLRAILDAEQGQKGSEGWTWDWGDVRWGHTGTGAIVDPVAPGCWSWDTGADAGECPTALEAMEAAEKALAEANHGRRGAGRSGPACGGGAWISRGNRET